MERTLSSDSNDGSIRYNELQLLQAVCAPEELQFPDAADPYYITLCIPLDQGPDECKLTFQLPENYPQTPLQLSIACDCFTREQTGLFQKALQGYMADLGEGEMQVYAAFEWAREHLTEFSKKGVAGYPGSAPEEAAVLPEDKSAAVEEDEYKAADKVTAVDLMDEVTAESQQFIQSLKTTGLFFNYESVTTHPLWDHDSYSNILKSNHKQEETVWEYTDPFVGSIYLTRDPRKTAGICVYCSTLGWELERVFFDLTAPAEESAWEASFENNEKGLAAFSSKLRQRDLPEILRSGARKLQTKLLEEAGFDATGDDDLDENTLNTIDDSVRKILDGQFDVSHRFKIVTYGIHVNSSAFGATVVTESKFNWSALGLTGRGKGINTKKLDGRNTEVQGRISRSDIFEKWMTDRVQMIEEWFKDSENKGKSLTVAIFCSKGRHRSVSAAILLRDLFYPNAVCEGHGVVGGALKVVKPKTK